MAKSALRLFAIRLRDLSKLVFAQLKRVSQQLISLLFQKREVEPLRGDVPSPQTADEGVSDVDANEPSVETLRVHYPEEDRMLSNTPWVKLVEECVELYSEIDDLLPNMTESQQQLGRHIIDRLAGILQRSGISLIDDDTEFDPRRHKAESDVPPGTTIVKTLRRGFALGRRVFLKAVVQVESSGSSSTSYIGRTIMAEAELSKVLKQADEIRRELLSLGEEMKTKAQSFELPKPNDYLLRLLNELDDNIYQVLVIGEAKRGKSTLVNALIGRDLLPTNVDIATNQAFRVRPSDTEAYRLRFEDGSAKEITPEDLGRYGSQVFADGEENPNSLSKIIRWIEVDVPARFIPPNVYIIDTPGLGSLYASHGEVTRRFIPYAHAVIFVLESQAPLSQPEIDILEEVLKQTQNIFFVQTKIDQFEKEQWQTIRRRNEDILKEKFGDRLPDVRIWPVSSVNLQKAVETGDSQYEILSRGREMIRALQEFLFSVTGRSRIDHALTHLRRYYRDSEELLSFRLKMLEEGEQKLQEAHHELSARRERLQRDWGSDGRKRRDLEKQLDQAIDFATEQFGDALSNIYDDASRKVKNSKSMNELADLVNSLPQRISEKLQEAWDDILKRYQHVLQDSLKSFSKDIQESTITPPISTDSTLVSKSGVPKIPEPSYSIDLKPVSKAVVDELPVIGAGAALLALGNVVPVIGTLVNPITTPIGLILLGYSACRILSEFWKAKQRAFEAARDDLLYHLESEFKKIENTFSKKLNNPLRQTLSQICEQLLKMVDAAVERRLEELAEEIARLDENCRLAAREREEKSARLRDQIEQWKAYARRLSSIEINLKQIQQTRISA